jgi:deferrochelatase/peroxidase EfeB
VVCVLYAHSVDPITRRRLLASAGAGAAGLGLASGGYLAGQSSAEAEASGDGTVPFYGEHQAGIATPTQDRLHFAAFDLETESRDELRGLMRKWSDAATAMTAGKMVGEANHAPLSPPSDTGETFGLSPANLTLTFGLGPSLFDKPGLALASRRPATLKPIPPLPRDELNELESGGDLCVQACSDDPQIAFHAIRDLARIGRGAVTMRWAQLGFGRTSSTSRAQTTPRNLMGFKDGTANIHAEDEDEMKRFVWLGDDDWPAWMRGGSYMVTRRIRMLLEAWDRSTLEDQERTMGREKYSGAPPGGNSEFETLDLNAEHNGKPLIADDAHVRLATSSPGGGERILRRSYSFAEGVDPSSGELDAGLFFICYQRDPERQFISIQRLGSAVFAVPPGASKGGYVGETLLG